MLKRRCRIVLIVLIGMGAGMLGCAAQPDVQLTSAVLSGDHGRARVHMLKNMTMDSSDRDYMLDRLRLAIATLGDGYANAGDTTFEELYEKLRTQGINEDKTVESVVLNEDLKFWKGEPFEQAMAFCYVGMHYAQQGDWGNMRAATENSLFYLRDFGTDAEGNPYDAETLATEAAEKKDDDVIDAGYTPVKSNFALGYMLSGIANLQMGRDREADSRFAEAVRVDPNLASLVKLLKTGKYNTIFVVDYGRGPQKVGTGPDNSVAEFIAKTPSDRAGLAVTLGAKRADFPQVLDLNQIAIDLMWNNLEDIRIAKSHIGSVLMAAGGATTGAGAYSGSEDTMYVGLGLMAAGAWAKMGAHADTRYCEILPQRTYIVPARVGSAGDQITFAVKGHGSSRLVLTGVQPPRAGQGVQLRYVRLPSVPGAAPAWAGSGKILYSNRYAPNAGQRNLPFILGGDCVRPPSAKVMADYQAAGYLQGMSLGELEELYRLEGIELQATPGVQPALHVLEGGNSLACPLPGTAGYARLFGQEHPPYLAKSPEVMDMTARAGDVSATILAGAEPAP